MIFVDRETKCLLCTVYAESRGQSKACQGAVASVIINRVRNAQEKGKPASICSIVSALGPFDGYNNKNYQQCANACLPAWPPELQDTFTNFQNGFLADCFDDLLVSQRHDYKFLYWGDSLRSHQIKHMIWKGLAVP